MRLRRVAVLVAALLCTPTFTLDAQQPIRILRHSPPDTARPGDVITISFDRPVVGSLDRTPDATRIVSIEPPLDARIEWRDPATLRAIPRAPLTPGSRYRIRVANGFTAIDGGRLASPYEFTILTKGPALIASLPRLTPQYPTRLDPNGKLQLTYSAAVDSAEFSRVARLELNAGDGCAARTIRYRMHTQRELAETDGWELRWPGGWPRDTSGEGFRRVVELLPAAALPEECTGDIVLPSLDPNDRVEIRYPVATQPRFAISQFSCTSRDCAAAGQLRLDFTAPIRRDSLLARLRIEPAVPFSIVGDDVPSGAWYLKLKVMPRTTYRVRVAPSLADIYGRRITGRLDTSLTTGNREPTLGHELGFFTVARAKPVLRITHVNVDSAELVIVPIPDSVRATVLEPSTDPDSVARMIARLRDTVKQRVSLAAPLNLERITEVAIPARVIANRGNSLLAIRARRIEHPRARTSPSSGRTGEVSEIVVVAEPGGVPPVPRTAIVQVTNLIAHAKVGDAGGAVLVTSARNGQPVRGAFVTVRDGRNRVMATGTSDAVGVADLRRDARWQPDRDAPANRNAPYWWYDGHARFIEATLGRDRSLTPLRPREWTGGVDDVSRLGAWYSVARPARASVFSDRGIYRPGEIAYVTAIVRRVRDGALLALANGDSVRLRIIRGARDERESQTIRDTVLKVNAFGTVTDSFRLSPSLALGSYEVRVETMAHEWIRVGQGALRVAEYRAPEFTVSLALDTTIRYVGDTLRGRVNASYYFGAPMAGVPVRWQASMVPGGGFVVPGLPPGFTVTAPEHARGPRRPQRVTLHGADTLNAAGVGRVSVPTRVDSIVGPIYVQVTTMVDDANRQPVSNWQATYVHPSRFYVAARDSGSNPNWRQGVRRRIEVLAVRPDGQRVRDVPVKVAVVRNRTVYVEQPDGSSPLTRSRTDTILRSTLRTADAPVHFSFTPSGSGQYEVVFTSRDEEGTPLLTAVSGYVLGPGWRAWDDNPVRIAVNFDRDEVAPGDTLVVRFTSPFPRAEAWVTVEGDVVLANRRLAVRKGETRVRIPVTDRFIPGAQVSVVLVDSSAAWRSDSTYRRLRAGYARLTVDRGTKALTVQVRAEQPRYRPADSARVTIAVRDHRGRGVRADVTLWAVDEGVLALTGTALPNPLDALYTAGATGLLFASTATRMASLQRFLAPEGWTLSTSDNALRFGRAATSPAMALNTAEATRAQLPAVRANFRSTAFYLAGLITDSAGRATASVKLPDNVTTFRVMAVATSHRDAFGSGETSVVVTKPLLARAALPRFTRTGDTFLAGAVVNNATGAAVTVRVGAGGRNIAMSGDTTVVRALAHGRGTEIRFDWRTDALPGDTATVRFDVTGGTQTDAVETSLPVRAPYAPRYHAVSGVARGSSPVQLRLPADIDPARSRLTLRVGTSPVSIVRASYAYLDVYAYQCSEQLASAGQVLLAMQRLQRAGLLDSMAVPTAPTLRGRLQFIADELLRRQDHLGGIGYWTRDTWTTMWLSAYAGTFLIDARAAGVSVDGRSIDRIARFVAFDPDTTSWVKQETYGTRAEREHALQWTLAQELAVLHFLRRAEAPDTMLENRLVKSAPRMLWEDRAWLTELLSKRSDRSAAGTLLPQLWRDVEMAGTRVDIPDSLLQTLGFRSHVRPATRLLRATLAVQPDHPRLTALVERVIQQGRAEQGRMWNTQDHAEISAVLADLAIAQRAARTSGPITVRSARGGAERRVLLSSSEVAPRDSVITLDGLLERDGDAMRLSLNVESANAPVFYVLTVDEVPLRPPTTPDVQGVIVERWFERFDDGQPVTEVKEGDLVRGRLRVTVPADREFVAIEDLLPAGLEVVDLSLRTASLGPFESEASRDAEQAGNRANTNATRLPWLYGTWAGGWWSPWEHREIRDDRVVYFARVLWKGSYTASYVARATTAGTFIRPPARAEEMYNPSVSGRSDGGTFRVLPRE